MGKMRAFGDAGCGCDNGLNAGKMAYSCLVIYSEVYLDVGGIHKQTLAGVFNSSK